MNVKRLGDDTFLQSLTDEKIILGVGTVRVNPARKEIVNRINQPQRWATVIHPFTSVSSTASIAPGVVILPCVVICTGSRISEHAIINHGANIDHDVSVGKFVHAAPQANLGGGSKIGDNAYLGMGAIVRDHVTVSDDTLVGMGAVVSRQYPAGSTLVGVPAKPKDLV